MCAKILPEILRNLHQPSPISFVKWPHCPLVHYFRVLTSATGNQEVNQEAKQKKKYVLMVKHEQKARTELGSFRQ